jgi:plastocyanin
MKRKLVAALVMALVAVGGAVLAKVGARDDEVREIRIVVRDMTFYLGATGAANPTLHLARGERVRLVLTNEDPGYSHNLIAPVLGVATPAIQHGRSQFVEVTVPDAPGVHSYTCGPHSEMMRGTIAIE